MRLTTRITAITALLSVMLGAGAAYAQEQVAGKPVDEGIGFQRPVTELARDLIWMDNFLLYIITAITVLVMVLLAIVILRFNKKANPEPRRFTHNAALEVAWTAGPVLILFAIAIPSLQLLDKQLSVPEPDVTIKATGYQWYWTYEYPEHGIDMSAYMIGLGEADLNDEVRAELAEYGYEEDEFRLATDTRVVVPVDRNVHLLVTAGDVIHAWTIPSFGVKTDAIPGRLNETWFRVEEPGTYFGQCSELCGMQHAYMPIVVEAVPQEEYDAWVAEEVAKARGETDVADASATTATAGAE